MPTTRTPVRALPGSPYYARPRRLVAGRDIFARGNTRITSARPATRANTHLLLNWRRAFLIALKAMDVRMQSRNEHTADLALSRISACALRILQFLTRRWRGTHGGAAACLSPCDASCRGRLHINFCSAALHGTRNVRVPATSSSAGRPPWRQTLLCAFLIWPSGGYSTTR